MPEEDRELFESRARELGTAEGAPPVSLRLSQGVHDGGADGTAEGVLAHADPTDGPLSPSDVPALSGGGAFDFLAPTGEGAQETGHEACVGNIKAFIRGGMIGLERLRKVLPNVFRTYPEVSPMDALTECGLHAIPSDGEFPTFLFNPLAGSLLSPMKGRKRARVEAETDEAAALYRSQELLEAYEAARSEWAS